MRLQHWINITEPGPSSSPAMQLLANDCWSYFGNHERTNIKKKLAEQPRMNPTDPKTFKSKAGAY